MTTTTEHAPKPPTVRCEPPAVVDQIITWGGVQAGDLVLWDGEMRCVEQRMMHTLRPDIKVSFRLEGVGMWQTFLLGHYTAVRRYVTGPAAETLTAAQVLAGAAPEWGTGAEAAIRYMDALAAIAERHLGRLPAPGDEEASGGGDG